MRRRTTEAQPFTEKEMRRDYGYSNGKNGKIDTIYYLLLLLNVVLAMYFGVIVVKDLRNIYSKFRSRTLVAENLNLLERIYENNNSSIECDDGNGCTKDILIDNACEHLYEQNNVTCNEECLKENSGVCRGGKCEGSCIGDCDVVDNCEKLKVIDFFQDYWDVGYEFLQVKGGTICLFGQCIYDLQIVGNLNLTKLPIGFSIISVINTTVVKNVSYDSVTYNETEGIFIWIQGDLSYYYFNVGKPLLDKVEEDVCMQFIRMESKNCLTGRMYTRVQFEDWPGPYTRFGCLYMNKCSSTKIPWTQLTREFPIEI